jgi:hypothetical protein
MTERQTDLLSILTAALPGVMVRWRTSSSAVPLCSPSARPLLALCCVAGLLTGRLRRAERAFDAKWQIGD